MKLRLFFVLFLAFALAFVLASPEGRPWVGLAAVTLVAFGALGHGLAWAWRARRVRWAWRLGSLGLGGAALAVYLALAVWLYRPDLLPQRLEYDFIANRQVTERLVDPALFKVDQWDIVGQVRAVLFAHPASSGSTALVYPVKIEPRTYFRSEVAMAPGAWALEGDGVTFLVYVEDDAGFHLLYSRYVDPKHQQQDRQWIPVQVDLSAFAGKLVRVILVTGSGPAGDLRNDWAGWGAPRLEGPLWP